MATVVREPETLHSPAPRPGRPTEEREAVPRFLRPRFAAEGFPWAQVAGYAGSLALTLVAFALVRAGLLPPSALLGVLLALAGGQAALQLGVFMHLRESRGPAWQILPLGLSLAIAVGLVVASLWIMAFKWGVS